MHFGGENHVRVAVLLDGSVIKCRHRLKVHSKVHILRRTQPATQMKPSYYNFASFRAKEYTFQIEKPTIKVKWRNFLHSPLSMAGAPLVLTD